MRSRLRFSVLLACLTGVLGASCTGPRSRPNVIVILSDTHRYDYAGTDRNLSDLTPNVAALARDGMTFTRAYTVIPASAPAYATLFTGLLPTEHGLVANTQPLRPSLPVLAEIYASRGYDSAAFVSNAFCSAAYGFNRGFGTFWDDIDGGGKAGVRVTNAALDWLEKRRGERPMFLFLAYMDAHVPFLAGRDPDLLVSVDGRACCTVKADGGHRENRVKLMLPPGRSVVRLQYLQDGYVALPANSPSPLSIKNARFADPKIVVTYASGVSAELSTTFRRASNEWTLAVSNPAPKASEQELLFAGTSEYSNAEHRRFYAEGVRAFDREMGRLITELKRRGQYEDSAIVFLSDHGEMLGEHEAWGHIRDLYEEAMHIPLVVKAPGVEKGSADDRRFDLRDVHRALLGIPEGRKLDLSRAAPPGELVAVAFPVFPETPSVAIYGDRLKLLSRNNGEDTQLFDVLADPKEEKNLAKTPEGEAAVRGLWDRLQREWRVVGQTLTPAKPTEEEKEALKALGYVSPAQAPAKR